MPVRARVIESHAANRGADVRSSCVQLEQEIGNIRRRQSTQRRIVRMRQRDQPHRQLAGHTVAIQQEGSINAAGEDFHAGRRGANAQARARAGNRNFDLGNGRAVYRQCRLLKAEGALQRRAEAADSDSQIERSLQRQEVVPIGVGVVETHAPNRRRHAAAGRIHLQFEVRQIGGREAGQGTTVRSSERQCPDIEFSGNARGGDQEAPVNVAGRDFHARRAAANGQAGARACGAHFHDRC